MAAIRAACRVAVDSVAEEVITEFGKYALADGAGKTLWRQHAAAEMQKIADDAAQDVIRTNIMLNPGLVDGSPYASQIMVALFGNHPPIFAQPGSEVWNDDMTGFRQSLAESVYGIPQFNWQDPGAQKWLNNSLKNAEKSMTDACEHILDGINIANYVHVG